MNRSIKHSAFSLPGAPTLSVDIIPRPITTWTSKGLLQELGWTNYRDLEFPLPHCYEIPPTTVAALADFFKKSLDMNVVRIVGEAGMKCGRIGVLVGAGSLGPGKEEMPARLMHDQQLDVMVCGEIIEWTLSAYVRDATALGLNKAMIIIGHERSEEPGMKVLAEWIRPLLEDIPVRFLDSGEPFIYF